MDYVPVSCALYDELELLAMRKQPVVIEMTNGETLKLVIKTFETRQNEGEFLVGAMGEELRLDQIKTLNGKAFGGTC